MLLRESAGGGDDDGGGSADGSATTTTTTTTTTGGGAGGQGGAGQGGAGGGQGGQGGAGQMFGFSMIGSDYPHNGDTVYVRARSMADQSIIDIGSATVQGQAFTVTGEIPGGAAYTILHFVDLNDNQTCDAASTDHHWNEDIAVVANAVALTPTHVGPNGTCF